MCVFLHLLIKYKTVYSIGKVRNFWEVRKLWLVLTPFRFRVGLNVGFRVGVRFRVRISVWVRVSWDC